MSDFSTATADHAFTRRQFVKGSVVVAASAAALASFGCSSGTSVVEVDHAAIVNPEEGGTWVPAACWHNCGGRCMNKVMVKDGVVIRQKTDDTHEDSDAYPQQRGCVRGRAQQQQCFGADRVLYPMKRKGWQPGGGANSNGEMRGKDEWERISWDDAVKYICDELTRIKGEVGNAGIFAYRPDPFVNAMGGCVHGWDTTSYGTYTLDSTLIGLPAEDLGNGNDRFDMFNADYVIMYASNPTWSAAGTPTYHYITAHEKGVKFISIDPVYNATAMMLDADWIRVRPGTDMAFLLALAYEMMRLDTEEGNIVDWDFLGKYTVGFDAEHMPGDASVNENLKDYVEGKYDNIPKTPQWAEPICGTPADDITSLARILGKNNKIMILHNYGMARCTGAELIPQMLMAIGAMGGHMGKSGHCCGSCYHANCGNAGPALVKAGSSKLPKLTNAVPNCVRAPQAYEIIANGGGTYNDVGDCYGTMKAAEKLTLGPIKAILHNTDASLQTKYDQGDGIKAHRKVDFVMSYAQFLTTNALYSDIVLPVTTEWETVGGVAATNREFLFAYTKVTEPLGEAKTDQEINTALMEGMGLDPTTAYDKTAEQQFYEKIASSTVDDGTGSGTMVPLVTITDDDIATMGVTGTAQTGIIGLNEFLTNGGYQVERSEGDQYSSYYGFSSFIADPDANPLKSASGKLEVYCQARYDLLMSFDFPGASDYKPYPTYFAPPIGYEQTFVDAKIDGTKGDYPYLLYNPHYMRRSHTVFHNCPWLRETWKNPVFLNRFDASSLKIKEGDTVLVSTKYGKCLRKAALMDNIIPGLVGLPHGAWVDVDEESGIDQAGSDNYLTGLDFSGMGVSGYNNQICNIEKYDGDELEDDYLWPQRIISFE